VYAQARMHNSAEQASADLRAWLSWGAMFRTCV
jgi:hypothetical protein